MRWLPLDMDPPRATDPAPWPGLRLWKPLVAAGRLGLNLLYPPSCLACHGATSAADTLCTACWRPCLTTAWVL